MRVQVLTSSRVISLIASGHRDPAALTQCQREGTGEEQDSRGDGSADHRVAPLETVTRDCDRWLSRLRGRNGDARATAVVWANRCRLEAAGLANADRALAAHRAHGDAVTLRGVG
jgi:hypothetical protein